MKLHEITDNFLITDQDKITEILKDWHFQPSNYSIINGIVNFNVNVTNGSSFHIDEFPFQIGTVKGKFEDLWGSLKTLRGGPTKVTGSFSISKAVKINSFEFFPTYAESINIYGTAINSLVGISDHIKSMNGPFVCDGRNIDKGGLGLVLINGCTKLWAGQESEPLAIIAKYISKGEDGLIECQSELIEAGYEEYAKL